MNPLKYLLPALYTGLTSTPVPDTDGADLPVYQYLPTGFTAPHYLLISQPTAALAQIGRGCRSWDCTVLLDVVTWHPDKGATSDAPADAIADSVSQRLDGQVLTIDGGLQMEAGRLESTTGLTEFDGEGVVVHRFLRLRYTLTLNS